ncbi:MAG: tetratricopeptide repeat protein [Bacteroidales bacterium]|nr:tetratricopeptide repeat protein [Bacteroidales bacterium]
MKKLLIILSSLIIAAAVFTGCNPLTKMVKKAGEVDYKTTPNPLEMHAGMVPIDVKVTFPAKYFGKKVKLVITPALVSDYNSADEVLFSTQTVIGEKFEDNYEQISYKEGGSFSFKDTIAYDSKFRASDFNLSFQISTQKGKSANVTKVKLCDGIITTPELVDEGMTVDGNLKRGIVLGKTVDVPVTKPEIRLEAKDAMIYFDLQKSIVKRNEIKKDEIDSLKSAIVSASEDPDKELKSIKIGSYASPDGPQDLNEKLVKDRGTSSKSAFEKLLSKEEIEEMENAEFLMTETTPIEDWEGFKKLVEESDMEDKDLVLRVLSMYSDPDTREQEIKKLAAVYDNLRKDILPMLRRSIIKFEYQGKAKSDNDLKNMATNSPGDLYQEEFLYAASICDDANKEQAYKNYVSQYPDDWKGWNNLGCLQAKQGKFSDAKTNFEKVLAKNSDNPAALNNLGAVALGEGDIDAAWDYFERAENAGCKSPNLGYNKGVVLIKRAKYSSAVAQFNNDSFNKALALTLSGDNDGAISTLGNLGSSEYGIFYYLKAVTAAKANKVDDVIENLRIAISKESKLKDYAKKDMEFLNFVDNSAFRGVIE